MTAIAYTVVATLPDERVASEYVEWLNAGHVDAVIRLGAQSASIVRVQEPTHPIQVETRYVFANRELFERYQRDGGPGLRAEGQRLFPPGRGVAFQRRIGVLV